jgi:GNAT superfamily N-acetyltransferase
LDRDKHVFIKKTADDTINQNRFQPSGFSYTGTVSGCGDQHAFLNQTKKIGMIRNVVMAYDNETAVGCGAFKKYDHETAEIKRMFVFPEHRGKGIAGRVLSTLEQWAAEEGFSGCILETGKKMTDAIRLYQSKNYQLTENYGQYIGVESSVCMKKQLTS